MSYFSNKGCCIIYIIKTKISFSEEICITLLAPFTNLI